LRQAEKEMSLRRGKRNWPAASEEKGERDSRGAGQNGMLLREKKKRVGHQKQLPGGGEKERPADAIPGVGTSGGRRLEGKREREAAGAKGGEEGKPCELERELSEGQERSLRGVDAAVPESPFQRGGESPFKSLGKCTRPTSGETCIF